MVRLRNRGWLYLVPASLISVVGAVIGGTIGPKIIGSVVEIGPYAGTIIGATIGAGTGFTGYTGLYLIRVFLGPHEKPDESLREYEVGPDTDD